MTPSHACFLAHSVAHMHLRGSRIVLSDKIDFISISRMVAHERSSLSSSLSSSSSTSSTSQVTLPINKHCDDLQNEEYGSLAKTTSSTGYEPNMIDNFDYSETYTAIFQNGSVDVDTEPSYSFDAELDDEFYQKSAIFTTVHSGARRTGEPETNLSLS